jgi:hypothetical protein
MLLTAAQQKATRSVGGQDLQLLGDEFHHFISEREPLP